MVFFGGSFLYSPLALWTVTKHGFIPARAPEHLSLPLPLSGFPLLSFAMRRRNSLFYLCMLLYAFVFVYVRGRLGVCAGLCRHPSCDVLFCLYTDRD